MPGEAWDGIAGVLSLGGGGRDGSGGLLQLAFEGQLGHGPGSIWLGQDKEGCSLPPLPDQQLGKCEKQPGTHLWRCPEQEEFKAFKEKRQGDSPGV